VGKRLDQTRTPYVDAILNYVKKGRTAFHMPGHARGRIAPPELLEFFGENVYLADLTEVEGLDYLHKPEGVLKEAQDIAADAFGADQSFFLVNGSTVGVVCMMLSAVKPKEKIILQRNTHRSAIAGLTLGDIQPIFIQSRFQPELNMMTGITPDDLEEAILANPDAKAVLLTCPNYFGMSENTPELIRIAHENDMVALVDEAHGVHLHFHPDIPMSAVDLRADMVVQSMHKTMPSFTQSSILHLNGNLINPKRVQTLLSYLQTSSPSYLLMASIDAARREFALHGEELIDKAIATADKARKRIKDFKYLYSFREEIVDDMTICSFDPTKLTICVKNAGYMGYECEPILNQKFNVEIELADLNNILCFITAGNSDQDIDHLMEALQYFDSNPRPVVNRDIVKLPKIPNQILYPSETFALDPVSMDFETADGEIAYEVIAPYPPGIAYTCPGEIITQEVVELVTELRSKGSFVQGITPDNKVKVVKY
jgi:arginine/lysine/ornithine decarboxylase